MDRTLNASSERCSTTTTYEQLKSLCTRTLGMLESQVSRYQITVNQWIQDSSLGPHSKVQIGRGRMALA